MITSPRNPIVQAARKLHKRGVRDGRREFLVEGANGVGEALRSAPVERLLIEGPENRYPELTGLARARGVRVASIAPPLMAALSSTVTPPGIVAVVRFVDRDPMALLRSSLSLVLVLDGVRDPGNAGTILRSATAAGVDAAFLGEGTVDVYNAKFVRATVGALFHLPFARNVEITWLLEELGRRNVHRVAADPTGDAAYDEIDFGRRTALVLGNESRGVAPELARAVDARVRIPMSRSVESLNVGMAATVLLFEAARQRRAG